MLEVFTNELFWTLSAIAITIIGLAFGYLVMLESMFISFTIGVAAHIMANVPISVCILLSLLIMFILCLFGRKAATYYIMCSVMSIYWYIIAFLITENFGISAILFITATLFNISLHIHAAQREKLLKTYKSK